MTNNYYQKQKKKLRKEARGRYQNLSEEEKDYLQTFFFISNTFISNARLKSTKIVNFCCLKIIHFLLRRYHPKIIRDI